MSEAFAVPWMKPTKAEDGGAKEKKQKHVAQTTAKKAFNLTPFREAITFNGSNKKKASTSQEEGANVVEKSSADFHSGDDAHPEKWDPNDLKNRASPGGLSERRSYGGHEGKRLHDPLPVRPVTVTGLKAFRELPPGKCPDELIIRASVQVFLANEDGRDGGGEREGEGEGEDERVGEGEEGEERGVGEGKGEGEGEWEREREKERERDMEIERERENAAEMLRRMSKLSVSHRICMGEFGAIPVLVKLLESKNDLLVEHAVTALSNLLLERKLKLEIGTPKTIEAFSDLMENARRQKARENAAGAICNLSVSEDLSKSIREAGAIPKLLNFVKFSEDLQVKRDAVVGLLSLALNESCRNDIVELGAVTLMLELLKEPKLSFEDEVTALIATLAKHPDGCRILADGGGVEALAEVLEIGKPRSKAAAVSALLSLSMSSEDCLESVANEGLLPSLTALISSKEGRGREKASALAALLREHCNGKTSK